MRFVDLGVTFQMVTAIRIGAAENRTPEHWAGGAGTGTNSDATA